VTVRRTTNQKTGLEQLADDLPDQFTNLGPYLDQGVPGLRMYFRQMERWLDDNGHNADALPTLLDLIGVDVATCYRHMLTRNTQGPGPGFSPTPAVGESRPPLRLVPDLGTA
jgi:hypothetical protein